MIYSFERAPVFWLAFHIPGWRLRNYHPSQEHIGNVDESLMLPSITSMMHQFYIEHRKHWWTFDATILFHPCFQCSSTLKPVIFHLLNINDSSIKHRWIIDETMMNNRWRNSYLYVLDGRTPIHKTTKSSNFFISNQIEQTFELKSRKAIFRTLSGKKIDWCS